MGSRGEEQDGEGGERFAVNAFFHHLTFTPSSLLKSL